MSAVARSSSPPPTAAVLEYMCLFTHDLRRKQKRWQDGRLKYHAFNKRVMVYDERGNFVGDMHWRHDFPFEEGEEIELERGGIIVQVSSLVARKETDLSELLDKRAKEKEQRQAQQIARSPAPTSVLPRSMPRPSVIPPDHFQLRHRSLHQVIGTPTGHHGRALVPNESPFEQRHQAAAAAAATATTTDSPDERAAKRRRHDNPPPSKSGYATSLFGQSLTLSATPASPVSMNRRPRPELNSEPPVQADPPDTEGEAPSVQREKPKISRQLNQRSGYAQGLFGQSLTLSHTPVSSLPPRRQPRHEFNSSSTPDVESLAGPQPALQEQPKASHHFNQSVSKPQPGRPGEDISANGKTVRASRDPVEGNVSKERIKGMRTSSLHRHIDEPKNGFTASADDDVIEINGPEIIPVQAARLPRKEKSIRQMVTNNQHTNDRPNATAPRHTVSGEKSASSRTDVQEDEREIENEKTVNNAQGRRTKAVASKAAASKRTAKKAVSEPFQDASRSFATSRRPEEPVTELRIKSRKRGLLMISDVAKKPRRLASESSIRSTNRGSKQSTNKSEGDISNSPLLNRDIVSDDEESESNTTSTRVQRIRSTELEDDDPIRSLPPEPLRRPILDERTSTKDTSGQSKLPRTEMLHESDNEVPPDDIDIVAEDATIDEATTCLSPAPNGDIDPQRIASSGEDEMPLSWPASSPKMRCSTDNGSKEPNADAVRSAREAGQKCNTAGKTKHQRPSRRKIVLEDDDSSVNDTEDDDFEINEVAPTKQSKSKRAAKATSRESRRVADLDMDNGDSVRALELEAKKQRGHAHTEPQEEQAEKRRRSTRQRRNRVDEFEELHLESGQDVSEDEQAPKKRQCRASRKSENRPRLERIKKNVKSRELIGFNLATLNAPLGPRGIGMPFKILSSPVSESIQRRVTDEAVIDTSPDLDPEDDDEQASAAVLNTTHSTTPELDQVVVEETSSTPLGERPTAPTPETLAVDTRINDTTRLDETVKPDAVTNEHFALSADTGSHSAARRSARASRKQRSKAAENTAPETKAQVAPESTEMAYTASTPAVATVTPIGQLQTSATGLQRQLSTNEAANNAESEAEQSEKEIKGSTESDAVSPAAAMADRALPSAPEPRSNPAIQQQNLTTAQEEDAEAEVARPRSDASDEFEDRRIVGPATGSRVSAPFKKQTPTMRKQSSTVTSVNGVRASLTDDRLDSARGDQSMPTHVSAAPVAVDESLQTSNSARPSSNGNINHSGMSNTPRENVECEQPIAGSDQIRKPIGLRRQTSAPQRVNNIAAVLAQSGASAGEAADNTAKPAARIVNPASRGRKAALASDAVGQVPQRVLPPTQPALLVPISTADLACTPFEPLPKEVERPKKKMTFPGFQSAKGVGPWSREAFDLLETGRPE